MKPVFSAVLSFLLFSCASTQQAPQPSEVVSVYATSAAQPWLARLYVCAGNLPVTLKIDANEPDIYLQVGEPDGILLPTYKIGKEEILVAANNASPVKNLSLSEARELFAQGNPSTQVWVFSSGADIQRAFEQLVMQGRSVSSSARVATSGQQLSAVLNSEPGAVGILTLQQLAGNVRVIFSAGVVPVLAITKQEPQGAVSGLIACLQGN